MPDPPGDSSAILTRRMYRLVIRTSSTVDCLIFIAKGWGWQHLNPHSRSIARRGPILIAAARNGNDVCRIRNSKGRRVPFRKNAGGTAIVGNATRRGVLGAQALGQRVT